MKLEKCSHLLILAVSVYMIVIRIIFFLPKLVNMTNIKYIKTLKLVQASVVVAGCRKNTRNLQDIMKNTQYKLLSFNRTYWGFVLGWLRGGVFLFRGQRGD